MKQPNMTMCKQMNSHLFKNTVNNKLFHLENVYIYKLELALNNHQGLICHQLYTLSMNTIGYIPSLINMLDTIVILLTK